MTLTFLHHGDIGDIIYSLPVIKGSGGGVLYLDVEGGKNDPEISKLLFRGKLKFNQSTYDYIFPLLKIQPYIQDVKIWKGEKVDVNLSKFREAFSSQKNLVKNHTDYFNIPFSVSDAPWLSIPGQIPTTNIILFSRTLRQQSNYPVYLQILYKCLQSKDRCIFLGTSFEHRVFEETFDVQLPHYTVDNALNAAHLIQSSKLYVTNQGGNHAIAVALAKEPLILEIQHTEKVCYFENRNVQYI